MEDKKCPKLPWMEWKYDGYLGHGGFGDVYRIRREEYEEVFYAALKVVKLPADENEARELEADGVSVSAFYRDMVISLKKEISVMFSLKGASNIVTIEDYKIEEQENDKGWILFIRMELLMDLNQYRKKHPMSKQTILKMGCDICNALEACRKKHIIHRDIKPSNILVLEEFEEFKLGDFGISRKLEHTMSGLSRKGTEIYMAPEVYKGESYNEEVDIYSLGLVMYRLLNGNRLPFEPKERTSQSIREAFQRRMRGEEFPDPVMGGKEIGDVLRKACHIDPRRRYQSAAEFKAALVSCQGQENVKTKPHPMKPRHKEPKVQLPAQKLNISEETVEADSGKKEHTPVIKTENKKQRTKKNTKGNSWKYVALGIGLLALAGVAGAMNMQKKPDSNRSKIGKEEQELEEAFCADAAVTPLLFTIEPELTSGYLNGESSNLTVSGTGCSCKSISVSVAGMKQDKWIDNTGIWEATFPMDGLPEGQDFTISAEYKDVNGAGYSINARYDSFCADASVVSPIYEAMTHISGMVEPGTTVALVINGDTQKYKEMKVDRFGRFAYDDVPMLYGGEDSFDIYVRDIAGNTSIRHYEIDPFEVTGTVNPMGKFLYSAVEEGSEVVVATPVSSDDFAEDAESIELPLLMGMSYEVGTLTLAKSGDGFTVFSKIQVGEDISSEDYTVEEGKLYVYTSQPSIEDIKEHKGREYKYGDTISLGDGMVWIVNESNMTILAEDIPELTLYDYENSEIYVKYQER